MPELVPIRHGRMLVSPFTFYRGARLRHGIGPRAARRSPGLTVQLCGDAHLSNFGGFASPERQLVFDINDFDETLPGPWEWDVKRLAASFEIAGRDASSPPAATHGGPGGGRSYREAMRPFAAMRDLDVWYSHLDIDTCSPEIAARRAEARPRTLERRRRQGAHQGQHEGVEQADRICRRRAPDPQRPSASSCPIPDLFPTSEATKLETRSRTLLRSTAPACRTIVAAGRALPATPTWPARSSVSAAWAPVPGSC